MTTELRISEMKLSGNPGRHVETRCLAKFSVDCGPVMVPRFSLIRTTKGSIQVIAPTIHNSFGAQIIFARGVQSELLTNVVDLFLMMGGKFPEDTVAPKWMELDGDPKDWGGLIKQQPEAAA